MGNKYFDCIDLHCGGEPARVLISGAPDVPGSTMKEKRTYFMEHHDDIRRVLLQEPRGYPCQNLNIIYFSTNPKARYGYIILEQGAIYPLFSGHNTICVATALLETGMIEMTSNEMEFELEAPGGLIGIKAQCNGGKVKSITMRSMPSFVGYQNRILSHPVVNKLLNVNGVEVDVCFGGMWFVIVDADSIGLDITPRNGKRLAKIGEVLKIACKELFPIDHPVIKYPGPDILAFTSTKSGRHVNTVVMSNGTLDWKDEDTFTAMLDRSPCGSGTASIMANLYFKGKLKEHDVFENFSIMGSKFTGRIAGTTKLDNGSKAIIPEITGNAFITAFAKIVIDPDDQFPTGFTVGDIWAE